MFDQANEVRLVGVIKELRWTNPHAWIEMDVPTGAGKTTQWSVKLRQPQHPGHTTAGPQHHPGDHVTITCRIL